MYDGVGFSQLLLVLAVIEQLTTSNLNDIAELALVCVLSCARWSVPYPNRAFVRIFLSVVANV